MNVLWSTIAHTGSAPKSSSVLVDTPEELVVEFKWDDSSYTKTLHRYAKDYPHLYEKEGPT